MKLNHNVYACTCTHVYSYSFFIYVYNHFKVKPYMQAFLTEMFMDKRMTLELLQSPTEIFSNCLWVSTGVGLCT